MKRPLVVGNWKMNLDFVEAIHLVQQIGTVLRSRPVEHVDIVVAPPFVDLRSVTSVIESERVNVGVAAQHLSVHDAGAFTGEVSAAMLRRLAVTSVIVGHSERRTMYAMSDVVVNQTLQAALRHGLAPILCVGESLDVREADEHLAFVSEQIRTALTGMKVSEGNITVAYEPVWAIGTGRTAGTDQVREMMHHIRSVLAANDLGEARVLYGGSVTADNARDLIVEGRADGFLVGGASLKAESFLAIAQSVNDCYDEKR